MAWIQNWSLRKPSTKNKIKSLFMYFVQVLESDFEIPLEDGLVLYGETRSQACTVWPLFDQILPSFAKFYTSFTQVLPSFTKFCQVWPGFIKFDEFSLAKSSLTLSGGLTWRRARKSQSVCNNHFLLQSSDPPCKFHSWICNFPTRFLCGNSGQYSAQNMQWPDYTRWYKACLKQEYIHIFG